MYTDFKNHAHDCVAKSIAAKIEVKLFLNENETLIF